MKNPFSETLEETAKRKRNIYRIVIFLLVILIAFDVVSPVRYLSQPTTRLLFAAILSYGATIATLICAWLLRRNQITAAAWGLIAITLVSLVLSPFLGSGSGPIYGVTAIFLTAVIAGQGLPSYQIARANALGLLTGIAIYLLDTALPPAPTQATGGTASLMTSGILITLLLALMFVIARQFRDYTIRTKLIILFLAVSIIPLTTLTFSNYLNSQAVLMNNADNTLSTSASLTADQLDGYFTQNLNTIRSEAQLPDIIDYLDTPTSERAGSETEARAQRFINVLAHQDPVYILSISIIDPQGFVLADSNPLNIQTNRSSADYFVQVMKTGLPYATSVKFDQQTNTPPSIYFATTVRDTNGKVIGILSKQYKALVLQAFIVKNSGLAGSSSFSVLLDANHLCFADGSDQTLIYKTLIPLNPKTVTDLQSKQLLPPGTPEQLSINLTDFEANLSHIKERPIFTAELHLDNSDLERAAVINLKTQPWIVVSAQPQNVFLAPIDIQKRNNVLITILISSLVAGFGFIFSQSIAGPISRLTKAAKSVTEGDLFISAPVETKDEIGGLALSFNTMTKLIRDLINSLEKRVEERTAAAETARAQAEISTAEAQAARKDLEAQIWLVTGQTQLADSIRGEQNMSKLAENIIAQISEYLGAQAGALYLMDRETLKLTGTYSFSARPGFSGKFQLGEGLVGQAAADRQTMLLTRPENATVISSGLVDFAPRQVLIVPFEEGGQVAGVLELATLTEFTQKHEDFLARVSESIGIAFRTVQARQRLADVLMETQQQAEELQAQEEELRAANEELQAQAENLTTSRQNRS